WKKEILPSDRVLKPDAEGVWITRNNQRMYVAVATESGAGKTWTFSVKPKSYEMLVLLCWDKSFVLRDFVVPQKLFLAQWVAAKKRAGKENIVFSVSREEGRFLLNLPESAGIDITDTEANYTIIPSN
ncbi:MAG TPA: hypothetical protein VGB69_04270, partial [Edaphobacter sp.]